MEKQQLATLLLRIMLGASFLIHGLSKFQGGVDNTAAWFDSIGLPGGLAYVVAIIEVLGGILMILGIATRYVAIAFVAIMLGAIFSVKAANGFLGNDQGTGYELELVLAVMAIYFVLAPFNVYSFTRKKA